jgi:RNA-directed DNA polymerase
MRTLALIRKYLQAGIIDDGIVSQHTTGTPQDSPLSSLLSNIVLDELDKELENKDHSFVKYAVDCSIYAASERAAQQVYKTISK